MNRSSNQEGCSCHSAPPCSYCVDTFACKVCGDRVDASEWNKEHEETCEICVEKENPIITDDWRDNIPIHHRQILELGFVSLPLPSEVDQKIKAVIQPLQTGDPLNPALMLEAMYIRQRVRGIEVGWELYHYNVLKDELSGR